MRSKPWRSIRWRFLVVPKFLAMAVMMPCLAIWADLMGVLGGSVFGVIGGYFTFGSYLIATRDALLMRDVTTGVVKSLVFGLVITAVGCQEGFSTGAGAEEVGRSTTSAVVISILLVILIDLVFTTLFYVARGVRLGIWPRPPPVPAISAQRSARPIWRPRGSAWPHFRRRGMARHWWSSAAPARERALCSGLWSAWRSRLPGEVRIKGVDITKANAREMDAIRKKIGLAFQGGALIGSLSVGENIALPLLEHTTLEADHYRGDGSHQAGAGGAERLRESTAPRS